MIIYKNNIVKCKICDDIIRVEFKHREDWSHRYLHSCTCGAIRIDPSPYMWRLLYPNGNMEDYVENLSEEADEEFLSRSIK